MLVLVVVVVLVVLVLLLLLLLLLLLPRRKAAARRHEPCPQTRGGDGPVLAPVRVAAGPGRVELRRLEAEAVRGVGCPPRPPSRPARLVAGRGEAVVEEVHHLRLGAKRCPEGGVQGRQVVAVLQSLGCMDF